MVEYTMIETGKAKRFILPSSEEMRRRIRSLREAFFELKTRIPKVLSLCLYGSITYGEATPQSDIDGYIFIEEGDGETVFESDPSGLRSRFTNGRLKSLQRRARIIIQEKTGLSNKQLEHVRVLPVSYEIIDRHIDSYVEYAKKCLDYLKAVHPQNDDPHNLISITEEQPRRPDFLCIGINIYAMFFLALGTGINVYRRYLIEKLENE